ATPASRAASVARAPSRRTRGAALLAVLVVATSGLVGGLHRAGAADPARAVAAARAAVDRAAEQYFAVQRHVRELDATIADLDARITAAAARARAPRATAAARAATLYRAAGASGGRGTGGRARLRA